ncbi:DUF4145 domain-containing protein [Actinomadura sp. 9N215]|uniref:DUF4145 domain-containing protein n=1 Tax=Actinomadura sp. 9N215 TaxID=3375150 RepID=UPI00378B4B79
MEALAYVAVGAALAVLARWAWLRASPSRRALNRTLRQKLVPQNLLRELADARTCYNAKAFTATVVMVRRTLEAVCADEGFTGRNLSESLKKMEQAGRLDPMFCKWAHDLRVLGNEGAHFTGKPVDRVDASDALELARAMLEYQYVLAAQYRKFAERRSKGLGDQAVT